MAEVRIEGSDLDGAVLTNAATEETLREILKAINNQESSSSSSKRTGRTPFDWLEKDSKDAENAFGKMREQVEKHNKELQENSKSFKNYTKGIKQTTKTLDIFDRGISGIGSVGNDVQSQMSTMGAVVSESGNKIADSLQLAGAAISLSPWGRLAKIGVGLLTTATGIQIFNQSVTAAIGVLGGLVGIAEGFRVQYEQLNRTGFILDSQFAQLVQRTNTAGITIADLTQFVERNRRDLALFSGSVTRGTNTVLDLRKRMGEIDDEMVDRFIRMGVSLEEIPDVLSNYMAIMGRSGRRMQQSDEEMLSSAEQLYKQQRLLADLTGDSVDSIKQESLERTRAARVQAAFIDAVPGAAQSYANAAGVFASLGPEFEKGFEAVFAGDKTDKLYQAFTSTSPAIFAAMQSLAAGIKQGGVDQESAQQETFEMLKRNAGAIDQELTDIARVVRFSDMDTPYHMLANSLGMARERIDRISKSTNYDEMLENLQKTADGQKDAAGAADPMLKSFTNIEKGTMEVRLALQSVAMEISETFSDEATDIFKAFTGSVSSLTDTILDKVDKLENVNLESQQHEDYSADSLSEGVIESGFGHAIAGAGIGSLFPVVGTGVGALIGGVVGALTQFGKNLFSDMGWFDDGGVAKAPKSGGMAMLHGTEAVVPLPDGESIPVRLKELPAMRSNITESNFDRSIDFDEIRRENQEQNSKLISGFGMPIDNLSEKMDSVISAAEREVEIASSQNQKTDRLITVSRNMLEQMTATSERLDRMVSKMDENNYIASKSRFSSV